MVDIVESSIFDELFKQIDLLKKDEVKVGKKQKAEVKRCRAVVLNICKLCPVLRKELQDSTKKKITKEF